MIQALLGCRYSGMPIFNDVALASQLTVTMQLSYF